MLRYYTHSDEKRLCLFNYRNGLVFEVCAFLKAIYLFTSILLSHEILISMDESNRYYSALDYKTPKEVYFNGKRSLKAGMDK